MKRFLVVAALLLLASCGAFGTAQAHTLSLAYKAGDAYTYRFHSTSKQTIVTSGVTVPAQIEITAKESVKVNSVDSSGTADVAITFSDLSLKEVAAGVTNTTTGLPASTIDLKIAADGTISSIEGNQVAAGGPLSAFSGLGGGFFVTAVLPHHPVKPGDKWSKAYDQAAPAGNLPGTLHITSDSTYLRDESFNGVTAAVVETKSTGTIDFTLADNKAAGLQGGYLGFERSPGGVAVKGTFTTDVTTWIDPSGHRIMKSHATAHDNATIDLPAGVQSGDGQTPAPFKGPVTVSGDSTTDLSPA